MPASVSRMVHLLPSSRWARYRILEPVSADAFSPITDHSTAEWTQPNSRLNRSFMENRV